MSQSAKNFTVVGVGNVLQGNGMTIVTVKLQDLKTSLVGPVEVDLTYKVPNGTPPYVKVGGTLSITVPTLDEVAK